MISILRASCISRHILVDVWIAMVRPNTTAVGLVGRGTIAMAAMGAGLAVCVAAVNRSAWPDGAYAELVAACVRHVVVLACDSSIAIRHSIAVRLVVAFTRGSPHRTPYLCALVLLVSIVERNCTWAVWLLLAASCLVVFNGADGSLAGPQGCVRLQGPAGWALHLSAPLRGRPIVTASGLVSLGVAILAWNKTGSKFKETRHTTLDGGCILLEVRARFADESLA